jgi:hypothetical protein
MEMSRSGMKIRSCDVEVTTENLDQFSRVRGEAVQIGDKVTLQIFFENRESAGDAAIIFEESPEVEVSISLLRLAEIYRSEPEFRSNEMHQFLLKRRSESPVKAKTAQPAGGARDSGSNQSSVEGSELEAEPRKPGETRDIRRAEASSGGFDGGSMGTDKVSSGRSSLFEALLETIGLETLLPALLEVGIDNIGKLKGFTLVGLERRIRGASAMKGSKDGVVLSAGQKAALRESGLLKTARVTVKKTRPSSDVDEDGSSGGDVLEEVATPSKSKRATPRPKSVPKPIPPPPSPVPSDVLDGAPFAKVLLIGVADELSSVTLVEMANELAMAAEGIAAPKIGMHASAEEAVDAMDVLFDRLITSGRLPKEELRPRERTARGVRKHLKRVCLDIVEAERTTRPRQPSGSTGGEGQFDKLASVLAHAQETPMSVSDQKVFEEISASTTRVCQVADDETLRKALAELAEFVESDAPNDEKLKSFAEVANSDARTNELLFASHIREDKLKGDMHYAHPCARETAKCVRRIRNAVVTAGVAVGRKLATPTAEVLVLVEKCFGGLFVGAESLKLGELGDGSKLKPWLGVNSANKSPESMLLTLMAAMSAVSNSMALMRPADHTVHYTFGEMVSHVTRGMRYHSLAVAVEGLIVPVFRAYGDACAASQKSASLPIPRLGDIWRKECADPSSQVGAYIQRTAAAEVTGGGSSYQPSSSPETEKVLSELKKLTTRIQRAETTAARGKGPGQPGGGAAAAAAAAARPSVPGSADWVDPLTPEERAKKRASNKLKRTAKSADAKVGREQRRAESDDED